MLEVLVHGGERGLALGRLDGALKEMQRLQWIGDTLPLLEGLSNASLKAVVQKRLPEFELDGLRVIKGLNTYKKRCTDRNLHEIHAYGG